MSASAIFAVAMASCAILRALVERTWGTGCGSTGFGSVVLVGAFFGGAATFLGAGAFLGAGFGSLAGAFFGAVGAA